jgi:hypothetical protein
MQQSLLSMHVSVGPRHCPQCWVGSQISGLQHSESLKHDKPCCAQHCLFAAQSWPVQQSICEMHALFELWQVA